MKDECKVSMYEFSLKDFPEPGSTDRQLQRLPWTIGHHMRLQTQWTLEKTLGHQEKIEHSLTLLRYLDA